MNPSPELLASAKLLGLPLENASLRDLQDFMRQGKQEMRAADQQDALGRLQAALAFAGSAGASRSFD